MYLGQVFAEPLTKPWSSGESQTSTDPRYALSACPSRVSSVSCFAGSSVCLSSLQIFSNSIINTRNLTPLKTFTEALQPYLMALERRKWGLGKAGCWWVFPVPTVTVVATALKHTVSGSQLAPRWQELGVSDLLWGYGCWSPSA